MAVGYNPKIVTDGLVLALDAGNTKSYPGSGTAWTDLSGNRNNGTLENGPTYSSADGGSIVFDGTNDYLSIENSNDFEFGSNDFTVEFWFNCTKSSAAYQILASRDLWTGGGGQTPWMIQLTNSDTVLISGTEEPNPGGWSFSNECSVSVQRNVWNHIAFTRNGNTLNLYANGIKSADHTFSASFEASSNDFIIGRYSSGQYFEGYISNLRVCKGLTASEVSQNYNAFRGRFGI